MTLELTSGSVQLNVTNLPGTLSLGSTGDLGTGTTITDITTVNVSVHRSY